MRRSPIYLLIDTSESMAGAPLENVRMGLELLVSDLRQDPIELESAWLSVITFGGTVKQLVPLTDLTSFHVPSFEASGTCCLGAALDELLKCSEHDLIDSTADRKGDYRPFIFLMTNGQPADKWEQAGDKVKCMRWPVLACSVGPGPNEALLKRITEWVVDLNIFNPGEGLKDCKRSIENILDDGPVWYDSERVVGTTAPAVLPPPPPGINIMSW